jgi:hypothetical protein
MTTLGAESFGPYRAGRDRRLRRDHAVQQSTGRRRMEAFPALRAARRGREIRTELTPHTAVAFGKILTRDFPRGVAQLCRGWGPK